MDNEDTPARLRERNRQLEMERMMRELLAAEREMSGRLYAIKIVERIVFAFMGLIATAFFAGLIAILINYKIPVGP